MFLSILLPLASATPPKHSENYIVPTVFNPLHDSDTLFYFEICVGLDHFVDIRKGLWTSEDQ
ncbi:hypothetical protein E2C01_018480 [Portunus trituberculatus]|uniref:Uncharacterized protein n=1 Tax=Portunus trituberculatus TaxID=210409 RepID=A0A5B7DUJ5_PORTR|nr:hypothetical protein [Portunus trituberculatus]